MARRKLEFRTRALTINCTDVKRSAWFYGTVLGAPPVPTDNGVGWWYRLGTLEITLLTNAREPSPARFPDHAMPMLWLEVDDLTEATKRFVSYGVEIIDPGDGNFLLIADPDGLVIEVWQSQGDD